MPTTKSRIGRLRDTDLAMHVAVLEQQTVEMASRFEYISTRFEKILDRVEQLTLNTTTLITQHDTQINGLQQQVIRSEEALKHTQKNSADQLQASLDSFANTLEEFKDVVQSNQRKTDDRLSSLERVRWIIIGIGMAVGYAIANAGNVVSFFTNR